MKRRKVTKYEDPLQQAAHNLGVAKGIAMAKMVVDKATTPRKANILIKGFADSDERVLDVCPKPLEANGDTAMTLIDEIASLANAEGLLQSQSIESAVNSSIAVLDIFEEGYTQGFWAEAILRSHAILEAAPVE
jgi:hypothetical protein